jgi:hypothetical protein
MLLLRTLLTMEERQRVQMKEKSANEKLPDQREGSFF